MCIEAYKLLDMTMLSGSFHKYLKSFSKYCLRSHVMARWFDIPYLFCNVVVNNGQRTVLILLPAPLTYRSDPSDSLGGSGNKL